MSQITRCPSCSTSFKVVADQLRISEGWVRCGQCKEVFDAAAHLLPAPPPALLPDVSLTDVRPPPVPVPRKPDAGRAWGESAAPTSRPFAAAGKAAAAPPGAPLYTAEDFSLLAPDPAAAAAPAGAAEPVAAVTATPVLREEDAGSDLPRPGLLGMPVAEADPVLAVPDPAVPAFLAAGATGERTGEDLGLEPLLAPFAWRTRGEQVPAPGAADTAAGHGVPQRAANAPAEPVPDAPFAVALPARAEAPFEAPAAPPSPFALPAGEAAMLQRPAGYELPVADLSEDDEDRSDMPSFESTVPAELTPMGYPALELPIRPSPAASSPAPAPAPPAVAPSEAPSPLPAGQERAAEPLPSVDFIQHAGSADPPRAPGPEGLALVEDDSPAAVLQAKPRKARTSEAEEDEPAPPAQEEVSFVVAARRKAFWRKPAVRALLAMVLLVATLALALQVAVQERDRIAAMDARARPWLLQLCAPLQCEIAPRRQIADVVIDSSSFNKARGDSYQLTLAMKSRASIPLAMPAVELTLTDAQDQPVLRRVLLPTDMGAPAELSAQGEWSTSVSVVVTTGGARVAGYRLLAFYP